MAAIPCLASVTESPDHHTKSFRLAGEWLLKYLRAKIASASSVVILVLEEHAHPKVRR